MVCAFTASPDVVQKAVPGADKGTTASVFPVVWSTKVTLPVGAAEPASAGLRVAGNVTGWFKSDGFTDEVTATLARTETGTPLAWTVLPAAVMTLVPVL